jgi:hypothetical protein
MMMWPGWGADAVQQFNRRSTGSKKKRKKEKDL